MELIQIENPETRTIYNVRREDFETGGIIPVFTWQGAIYRHGRFPVRIDASKCRKIS